MNGRVFGHIDGKGRLTHRRTPRNDNEIPWAQPSRHLVEFRKARRQTTELVGVRVRVVDLIDDVRKKRAHGNGAGASRAAFRNFEDPLLGLVDQLARRLAVVVEDGGGDFRSRADQLPQQ